MSIPFEDFYKPSLVAVLQKAVIDNKPMKFNNYFIKYMGKSDSIGYEDYNVFSLTIDHVKEYKIRACDFIYDPEYFNTKVQIKRFGHWDDMYSINTSWNKWNNMNGTLVKL